MSKTEFLLAHARTMCMMFRATGDNKYLKLAKEDIQVIKDIKVGFMRPLGCIN